MSSSTAPVDDDNKATAEEKGSSSKVFSLKKGAEKRSLSVFAEIQSPTSYQAVAKKCRMDHMDDAVSGDELEELDDSINNPLIRPPNNFASFPNSPGFRTLPTGIQSAKKLVIKNFKKKNTESVDLLAKNWTILEESVIAIQQHRKIKSNLEQLYKLVEVLCAEHHAPQVYEKLMNNVRSHTAEWRSLLAAESSELSGTDFLRSVELRWSDFCSQMINIRSVFLYLDRTYVLQNASVMSIWDAGVCAFREEIMEQPSIQKRTIRELLSAISDERSGNQVDRTLLRSLLRMLTSLQVYSQMFETPFLTETTALYTDEGVAKCRDLDVPVYLSHVASRLSEEEQRVEWYLDPATRKPLIAAAESALIAEHADALLSRGLDQLLDEHRLSDLSLLHDLLARTKDGLQLLRTAFSNYVKKKGRSVVLDAERDKTMVAELLEMKEKLDTVVEKCFHNTDKFVQAEKDAFDSFVNSRPNKPAELIAKFMDSKLQRGNKDASDEELESLMDRLILLFRFIQGKDVFEAFYKKDLAKRLLLGRSASVDAEKAMLSKLKQECGAGFTQKLEGMFKDMELSKDLGVAFRQHCESDDACSTAMTKGLDFCVNVLTMGQWPQYEYAEVTLPMELGACQQQFQQFYLSKHSSRKLQWQHSLGQCLLKARFREGCTKELQVSLYQAIVLLLFNCKVEWGYKEIVEATKIEKSELGRTLQSLACAKPRVIHKSPKGKEIEEGDSFTFNADFNEKLHRIRICQVQYKETAAEQQQTEEQVNQDRQYQIDAAVVRIMKTRKTLPHQQLIAELFAQLRFPVKSADLKKRIGSLIERDYLTRDTNNPNTYNYVA